METIKLYANASNWSEVTNIYNYGKTFIAPNGKVFTLIKHKRAHYDEDGTYRSGAQATVTINIDGKIQTYATPQLKKICGVERETKGGYSLSNRSKVTNYTPAQMQYSSNNTVNEVLDNKYKAIKKTPINFNKHQIIYYGCPGSGKSFKLKDALVKRGIDEEHQKRVTFHPDTDYASFVGCYKPISVQYKANKQPILDYNGLVDRLKEYLEVKPTNITKACTLFGYDYHDSIVMMQEDNGHTIPQLVADAYKNGTTYDSQVRAGMSVYETSAHDTSIDSGISYSFCPQVFTQAYVQAWQNLNENVYLVIEEINRGNCAQIFGDLFQLLDRNNEGYSEYKVTADKDLADYLIGVLGAEHDGIKDGKLCLPPNLIIYATMNTSDQSLFPMDSAFKRRWEWEYVPIDYSENVKSGKFEITIGDKVYSWVKFLEIVNDKIYDTTNSEDKQMGNFFIKQSVNAEEFVNKVMFYLWNEVCKEEYGTQRNFFRKGADGKTEFKFTDLFKADKDNTLQEFMSNLGVKPLGNETEE